MRRTKHFSAMHSSWSLCTLSSGYLILEDIADDRSFDTWFKMLEPHLEQLGVHVQLMVSGRANALIKLALVGLECDHNADIFQLSAQFQPR